MVKPDVAHDYYADLSVSTSADADEIKKAFRKLALKYHPDRNPGKEVEFNAKFQDIQNAHEVLTDPEKRAKYDAERSRRSMWSNYVSPTSTDAAAATNRPGFSNFPPPPRRAPDPTRPNNAPPNKSPNPSAGANRYSTYASTNPSAWQAYSDKAQAQTRGDASKAWEHMKPGSSQQAPPNPAQSPPPPSRAPPQQQTRPAPPPRTTPRTNRPARANTFQNDPPPPRAADSSDEARSRAHESWDHYKAARNFAAGMNRANTMRVPKKSGFDPANTSGDEPAARNASSYFPRAGEEHPQRREEATRPARTQFHPPPPPPPPPPLPTGVPHPSVRKPDAARPDPIGPFKSPDAREFVSRSERTSTPYASTGGERFSLNSDGNINRSASHASNLGSAGWPHLNQSQKNSPNHTTFSPGRHRSASPKMRSPRPQYSDSTSSSGSSSESDTPLPRRNVSTKAPPSTLKSTATHNANGSRRPSYPSVTVEYEDDSPPANARPKYRSTWHSQQSTDNHNGSQPSSRKNSSSAERPDGFAAHRMNAHRDIPASPLHTTAPWNSDTGEKLHERAASAGDKTKTGENGTKQRTFDRPSSVGGKDSNKFFMATDSSSGGSPMRNSSTENINTQFSPSDWHGKFGDGNDYLSAQPSDAKNRDGGSSSKRKPYTQGQYIPDSAKTSSTAPNSAATPLPPSSAAHPVPAPTPLPAKFPSEEWTEHFKDNKTNWAYPPPPPLSSPKRGKMPRKQSGYRKSAPAKSGTSNGVLEDDLTGDEGAPAPASEVNQDGGSATPMDIDPKPTPKVTTEPAKEDPIANIINRAAPPPIPPRSPSRSPKPFTNARDNTQSLNLNDLRNTAPFTASSNGLKDMRDLHNVLPFESATSSIPGEPSTPRNLKLPMPPKGPTIPEKLTENSWEHYIAYMRGYMSDWNIFNNKMITHFNSRQNEVEEKLPKDWMTSAGDVGYSRCMRGIEEDFRVREHWAVSWEKHREVLKGLAKVRERAKLGGLGTC